MIDFTKFKIEIHTNKETPIINNTNLFYIKDEAIDELFVKIYYDSIEIGQGIILDFYKEFLNIDFNGEKITQIKTFPFHSGTKEKYTNYGNKIYQLKYLKNPFIPKTQRNIYINKFANDINQYITQLLEINEDLKLAYISSTSQVPDDIAKELENITSLKIANVVLKNSGIDSKNITTFKEGIDNSILKYSIDESYLTTNLDTRYIIIDDVMGSGSSIATVLKKLYDKTQKLNYFFIVAKDVRR
jgi:pyrimidine operon attenuation protein/uracil phosphoribosyltransferase